MVPKTIKAVIFDCGNVLCRVENEHIKRDISSTLAVDIRTVERLWERFVPLLGKNKINELEFWKIFLKKSGGKKPLPKESLFIREFRKRYKVYDSVIKIVYQLKKKGIKLAILSNNITPQVKFLTSKGLFKPFDIKIFSNEVGVQKPDKKMYLLALKRIRARPQETIFVDDRLIHVEAAKKLGINGILFQNAKQLKKDLIKFK
ncbi:MAG: HAD family phosphatase [bacterium]|nr:HAD family phosphatase [bacterium]